MLFTSTTQLNDFAPIASTTSFDNLSPILRAVEEDTLIPIISQSLYDLINVSDETTLDQLHKDLLLRCRDVIAPLVAYNFAPLAEVKLSDAGAQRTTSSNFTSAYQNQVASFREQCLASSDKAIERLYKFLESNIATFTAWSASEEFKSYRSLFIKTGGEFYENFRTASPYTNFYAIRSFMQDVENNIIKKLIGADLFTSLKATDADPDGVFSGPEKELLTDLKKAIAFLTIAQAIPFLNVRLDAHGFTIISNNTAQNDNLAKRTAADDNRLNNFITACKTSATTYINNIAEWLKENNTTITESTTFETENTTRTGSFGFI